MLYGNWNFDLMHWMCFSVILSGVTAEPEGRPQPPPTLKIIEKGNYLNFIASPPGSQTDSGPQCWSYRFLYRKCNEDTETINVNEYDNWTAEVDYDATCKYTVQVQAKYRTEYCGHNEEDSDISEPTYFGKDDDPVLLFKVAIIIIPLIVCTCIVTSIVLFRRHKEMFLPKVPNPSEFFKDMFENKNEMTRGLYEPNEEVVEKIHVEPKTTNLH
ncbi:interleukin-13 receptor subunit alpha-1-like [Clarias magur]|uniref:Interleukin-13 receptor subunit alpha-1-like n=1 Tax=Clarias magur TaxID=1594786 RepID=A0A8J4TZJ9_CLAMG|nr:interleukin-13 receptor subunit alpha-1-like [Clarias magur]